MESSSTYTLLEISHFRQIAFQKFPSLEHSWPAMRACSLIVHGLGASDLENLRCCGEKCISKERGVYFERSK